jgi:hypothetical protein
MFCISGEGNKFMWPLKAVDKNQSAKPFAYILCSNDRWTVKGMFVLHWCETCFIHGIVHFILISLVRMDIWLFEHSFESRDSLLCWQEPATGSYPKQGVSTF